MSYILDARHQCPPPDSRHAGCSRSRPGPEPEPGISQTPLQCERCSKRDSGDHKTHKLKFLVVTLV